MRAGEIMTTGAATVGPDTSLVEAARLMIDHRISGLPVVDNGGKLIGIVTEHDLLRRKDGTRPRWLDRLLAESSGTIDGRDLREKRVAEVMSKDPIAVTAETPVREAAALMQRQGVKRVPVVEDGKVIGIISRANLVLALLRAAERASV